VNTVGNVLAGAVRRKKKIFLKVGVKYINGNRVSIWENNPSNMIDKKMKNFN